MNDTIQNIAISILTSGLFAVIFREWISARIKSAIEHEYKEKLARIQNELERQTQLEVQKIEIAASARNIKLTEVITIQVKTIAEMYVKIQRFRKAGQRLLNYAEFAEEDIRTMQLDYSDSYFKMRDYFDDNRIYIPDKASKLADETIGTIWRSQNVAGRLDAAIKLGGSEQTISNIEKRDEELQNKVQQLLQALEAEFKEIIGVHDKK
jgi:hypothetical protein